ncbi:hypothetical protein PAXRUDRAFT_829044 [Paxillus rubicundulus Ve08.2h10]|uniref:Uncharacterized protein n=1 Tax=Paxillus rubicundulus Ve08.2h10 TaxID=930991 RepID=A0A0D0E6L7_9AGAM|nr:hypothetical protein PAXRUDRAFT_829044 [Paxillus rubicundulus Ve08.2h10]
MAQDVVTGRWIKASYMRSVRTEFFLAILGRLSVYHQDPALRSFLSTDSFGSPVITHKPWCYPTNFSLVR